MGPQTSRWSRELLERYYFWYWKATHRMKESLYLTLLVVNLSCLAVISVNVTLSKKATFSSHLTHRVITYACLLSLVLKILCFWRLTIKLIIKMLCAIQTLQRIVFRFGILSFSDRTFTSVNALEIMVRSLAFKGLFFKVWWTLFI